MSRLRMTSIFAVYVLALSTSATHAQFVDTFSGSAATDSTNYTQSTSYGSGGAAFAINAAQQFQPTSPSGVTTQFYRNDSTLSDSVFGNTVSVEIDQLAPGGAAGLAFATSTSGANYLEFSVDTNQNAITNGPTGLSFNFALGPIIETVTRTADTDFAYTFSGPGLTSGPLAGTFTDAAFGGANVVFGLDEFSGFPSASAGQQIEDNLQFALTAPEPSTYALMLAGLAFLGWWGRRKGASLGA